MFTPSRLADPSAANTMSVTIATRSWFSFSEVRLVDNSAVNIGKITAGV